MRSYMEFIEGVRLINDFEVTITTGDIEYPGNAMEVCEQNGKELFHVVVDSAGEVQVLFLAQKEHYRISLSQMEKIIEKAKDVIRFIDESGN
jgi:hypothetical protein